MKMNHQPEIAIVEANTLTSLGLKGILEEMIPMATIRTFHQFSELMDDTPDMYAHYFISAQIYVEHNAFFLPRKRKTIVLASDSPQFQLSGVPVLNIHESEEELVKNILKLHQHAHHNGYPVKDMPSMPPAQPHQSAVCRGTAGACTGAPADRGPADRYTPAPWGRSGGRYPGSCRYSPGCGWS